MRKGGRNLLASSRLSSFGTFHSIVRSLLSSLEQHPEVTPPASFVISFVVTVVRFQEFTCSFGSFLQDEKGVVSTFSFLGQAHPTYTECIAQELLQEVGLVSQPFSFLKIFTKIHLFFMIKAHFSRLT